jgi:hypothetical protein
MIDGEVETFGRAAARAFSGRLEGAFCGFRVDS